jgi:hypothetical protein
MKRFCGLKKSIEIAIYMSIVFSTTVIGGFQNAPLLERSFNSADLRLEANENLCN